MNSTFPARTVAWERQQKRGTPEHCLGLTRTQMKLYRTDEGVRILYDADAAATSRFSFDLHH